MRVRGTAVLVALALAGGLAGVARADDKADITAVYGKLEQAFKSKNVQGVVALATPDFSETEANGKVYTAQQAEAELQQMFAAMQSVSKISMKPGKIAVNKNTATVMTSYVMAGTMKGPDGKTHTISDKGTSRDTLVKTAQGWKLKTIKTLTDHQTMDGKPFNPNMGAPPTPKRKK